MLRGVLDRLLYGLALLVLRGFYRSVEVTGRDRLPARRPVLVVANHYNGLVDAVLLVHVFGRVPRFLAKAALWRRRWARPFLAIAGILPIHRPEDRQPGQDNGRVFRSSGDALRRRGLVAIFPEGTTHDAPSLARIRTGAARLALSARAAGAESLTIVPVGMAFDDKFALRSRALARVGDPIDLDAEIDRFVEGGEAEDDTNQVAVRRLTTEIERRLRAVAPDYRDSREASVLSRAAEIAERTSRRKRAAVPLAAQEELAQRLARAPEEQRRELMDALARYHLDLDLVGLRDHQLVPGYTPRQLLTGALRTVPLILLLAPFALVGLVINIVPYWCVQAAGRATRKPMMKGTARALVALAVFPLAWVGAVLGLGRPGASAVALQLAALPICGLMTVAFIERLEQARRAWRGWQGLRERRALIDDIHADRARLVAAVQAAADRAPTGTAHVPG
jgi:glycerol-3-phosphate O-acyltransferase / dihydroxyacetone phosphate acyltransferase